MAVPPPSPDKARLRAELRATRTMFAVGPGAAAAQGAIEARLSPLLDRGGVVAGYVAHRGEPDVMPALRDASGRGQRIALPHIADGTMRFVEWRPGETLVPGHGGTMQPANGLAVVPALVLVPLVGFDRAGSRLGQGGGFYDRWLAAHPHATGIGIAWSVQERDTLPVDPWDVPLHAIVTERDWITP